MSGHYPSPAGKSGVFACPQDISVRVCLVPGEYSSEEKYAALGMGHGLVEIETLGACYRFGTGLDTDIADVTTRKIPAYCGLQESGPQWKAAVPAEAAQA